MLVFYVLWVSALLRTGVSSISRSDDTNESVMDYVKRLETKTDKITANLNSLVKRIDRIDAKLPARRTWKLQAKNVCFGAKNKQYGNFTMKEEGRMVAMKFVHVSGGVSCHAPQYPLTHWGCSGYDIQELFLFVTDQWNTVIYPKAGTDTRGDTRRYKVFGHHMNSNPLVLNNFNSDIYAVEGMELRLWYSEDLDDESTSSNDGTSCADVYVMFD